MISDQNSEKNIHPPLFKRWKIILPLIIGLSIAVWMIYSAVYSVEFYPVEKGTGEFIWNDGNENNLVDFTNENDFAKSTYGNYSKRTFAQGWQAINFTFWTFIFLFLALIMMVVRDLGYIMRIRLLTDQQLSWRQSFKVIMIWEFASAMTPGIVGGATVAMFILNREGINLGKSTAIVLITALMDELFYIFIVPLAILLVGTSALFPSDISTTFLGISFQPFTLFFIAFLIIVLIVIFLLIAVFFAPFWFKNFLLFFCRIFFLKRFCDRVAKTGDDIITASIEFKGKSFAFWWRVFGATVFSWMGRFLVINCLILAFAPMADQLFVFVRQLSMWVILLISPTPGGSGIAEFAFSGFLSDFIPFGMVAILAVLWRLISYYPYLLIGALILPKWLSNK